MSVISPLAVEGAEFVGVISRHRKLQFNYVLFERKSETFEFAGCDSVKTSEDQTVQVIWDAVRSYIVLLPRHGTNTGHRIEVYEV